MRGNERPAAATDPLTQVFHGRAVTMTSRPFSLREVQGEPARWNRSGQSTALVIPIRGLTAIRPSSLAEGRRTTTRLPTHSGTIQLPADPQSLTQLPWPGAELPVATPAPAGGAWSPTPPLAPAREAAPRWPDPIVGKPGWRTSASRRRGRRTTSPLVRTAPDSGSCGGGGIRGRRGHRSRGRPRSPQCVLR